MRKLLIRGLQITAIASILAAFGHGQEPERIQFGKGKRSIVVKASTGNNGTSYVVRARSGQMLILDLDPLKKVGIKVWTKGRFGEMVMLHEERGGRFEIGLEESGDYIIFIGPTTKRPVRFTLAISTRGLSDI